MCSRDVPAAAQHWISMIAFTRCIARWAMGGPVAGEHQGDRMTAAKSPDEFVAELWGYANQVPMGEHPWFKGIVEHRWARDQIVLGEMQHYLRVRTNIIHWGYIMINAAKENRYDLLNVVMENFMEEVGG